MICQTKPNRILTPRPILPISPLRNHLMKAENICQPSRIRQSSRLIKLTIRGRVLWKAKTQGKRNAARLNRRVAKEEVLYHREHRGTGGKPQGKRDPTGHACSSVIFLCNLPYSFCHGILVRSDGLQSFTDLTTHRFRYVHLKLANTVRYSPSSARLCA
jgi:hypothetical protein